MTARIAHKSIHSPVAYDGRACEWSTQHHALERTAAAERHISLPMGKRHGSIYHSMVERQSLTLVYSDGPRSLDRELTELSVNHFRYLLRLLIEFVASVLPCLRLHLYLVTTILRPDSETSAAYRTHCTYHAVVVAFLW